MHRRHFLKSAAVASVAPLARASTQQAPLRVALVGCGWYGKTDLLHLMQVAHVEVVALCDVDAQMLSAAADLVVQRQPSQKRPQTYDDYEQLLAREKPEVVLVATPDHWHCLPTIAACKAGCDVYVQKPISYDVVEGQAMVAAARKYHRTVQVGLQRRSTPHLIEARDRFIQSGKLGRVGRVTIHSYYPTPNDFPPPAEPPAHIDWDRYVGPADWRQYNPGIHPRQWRNCREFSNGQTGDLCVHFLDLARYFLGLGWPRYISAAGGIQMRSPAARVNVADTQTAIFDFDTVQFVWTQQSWGTPPDKDFPWGATFHGDKGALRVSIREYRFEPLGDGEPVRQSFLDESQQYPEDRQHKETEIFAAPATRRHLKDFLAARREGRRPVADIEEGHISSACCILANLSMELGRGLAWDAAGAQVADDDEANQRLARTYRGDWVHPTPDTV